MLKHYVAEVTSVQTIDPTEKWYSSLINYSVRIIKIKSKVVLDLPANIMNFPSLRRLKILLVVENHFKIEWYSALGDKSTGQAPKKVVARSCSDWPQLKYASSDLVHLLFGCLFEVIFKDSNLIVLFLVKQYFFWIHSCDVLLHQSKEWHQILHKLLWVSLARLGLIILKVCADLLWRGLVHLLRGNIFVAAFREIFVIFIFFFAFLNIHHLSILPGTFIYHCYTSFLL